MWDKKERRQITEDRREHVNRRNTDFLMCFTGFILMLLFMTGSVVYLLKTKGCQVNVKPVVTSNSLTADQLSNIKELDVLFSTYQDKETQ